MAEAKRGRPAAKAFDPFAPAEENYSPYEFYTRATNTKDHSVNVQTHFPPEIAAHMATVVQSGEFTAYTSSQALIRDAVIHRLQLLHTETGNFEGLRIIGIERAAARAEMRRQMKEKQREFLSDIHRELELAQADKDWDEMLRICDQTALDLDEFDSVYAKQVSTLVARARAIAEKKIEDGDEETL